MKKNDECVNQSHVQMKKKKKKDELNEKNTLINEKKIKIN